MINTRPLAIIAAKEVETLWLAGVSFERAMQIVRPKFASSVKKLKKCYRTAKPLGGVK